MPPKKKTETTQKPNVKFVGRPREEHGKTVTPEPFAEINDGERRIDLPSADEQRAGFYHAEAARLVRLYPALYKFIV